MRPFPFLLLCCLFFAPLTAFSQSDQPLSWGSRIGTRVELDERNYYFLFPQQQWFQYAEAFRTSNGRVLLQVSQNDSRIDTLSVPEDAFAGLVRYLEKMETFKTPYMALA